MLLSNKYLLEWFEHFVFLQIDQDDISILSLWYTMAKFRQGGGGWGCFNGTISKFCQCAGNIEVTLTNVMFPLWPDWPELTTEAGGNYGEQNSLLLLLLSTSLSDPSGWEFGSRLGTGKNEKSLQQFFKRETSILENSEHLQQKSWW